MTIFVSIVSYRDSLLPFTLRRAQATARWPDELHFGIVDQCPEYMTPELPPHTSYLRIDPSYARGPCWARSVAMSFYDGEDWFFQIDSHTTFDDDWDAKLIEQAKLLRPGRSVISSYPNPFIFDGHRVVLKPVTSKVLAHVVRPGAQFSPDHLMLPFEAHPVDSDTAISGFHLAAGCVFAPGSLVYHFPYDPWFYFHGEEQALALRLFTHGWDIFHVPGLPVYHLYNTTDNSSRPVHWAEHEWWKLEQRSRKRMSMLVAGAPLGAYGLGNKRSLHDYAVFSGIDFGTRTVSPPDRTCDNGRYWRT